MLKPLPIPISVANLPGRFTGKAPWQAKADLDRASGEIQQKLQSIGGDARVAVLKAIVSQASAAIPVVPLYAALLFRVMKEQGSHEECIEHIERLFTTQLSSGAHMRLDDSGRIRVDDLELAETVQAEVKRRWPVVDTQNLPELGDLAGFRADFENWLWYRGR